MNSRGEKALQTQARRLAAIRDEQHALKEAIDAHDTHASRETAVDALAHHRLQLRDAMKHRMHVDEELGRNLTLLEAIVEERRARVSRPEAAPDVRPSKLVALAVEAAMPVPPPQLQRAAQQATDKARRRRKHLLQLKAMNRRRMALETSAGSPAVDGKWCGDLAATLRSVEDRLRTLHGMQLVMPEVRLFPLFPEECLQPYGGHLGEASYAPHQATSLAVVRGVLVDIVDAALARTAPLERRLETAREAMSALVAQESVVEDLLHGDRVDAALRAQTMTLVDSAIRAAAREAMADFVTQERAVTAAVAGMLVDAAVDEPRMDADRDRDLLAALRQVVRVRRRTDAALHSHRAIVHKHTLQLTQRGVSDGGPVADHEHTVGVYVLPVASVALANAVGAAGSSSSSGQEPAVPAPPPSTLRATGAFIHGLGLDSVPEAAPAADATEPAAVQDEDDDNWYAKAPVGREERAPMDPGLTLDANIATLRKAAKRGFKAAEVVVSTIDLPKFLSRVTSMSGSPCGRYLAVGTHAGAVGVFDLSLGAAMASHLERRVPPPLTCTIKSDVLPPTDQLPVSGLGWGASGGQLLVTYGSRVVRVWSLAGQPLSSKQRHGKDKPGRTPNPFATFKGDLLGAAVASVVLPFCVCRLEAAQVFGTEDAELPPVQPLDDAYQRLVTSTAGERRLRGGSATEPTQISASVFFPTATLLGYQPGVLVAAPTGHLAKWNATSVDGAMGGPHDELPLTTMPAPGKRVMEAYSTRRKHLGSALTRFGTDPPSHHLVLTRADKFLLMVGAAAAMTHLKAKLRAKRRRKLRMFGIMGARFQASATPQPVRPKSEASRSSADTPGLDTSTRARGRRSGDTAAFKLGVGWSAGVPMDTLAHQAETLAHQDVERYKRPVPHFPREMVRVPPDQQLLGSNPSTVLYGDEGRHGHQTFPLVEHFEGHTHPVVFVGTVDASTLWRCPDAAPTGIVTVDSSGLVALWDPRPEFSASYGWSEPRHRLLVDARLPVLKAMPHRAPEVLFPSGGSSVPTFPDDNPKFVRLARAVNADLSLGPLWDRSTLPNGFVQTRHLPVYLSREEAVTSANRGDGTAVSLTVLLHTQQGTLVSHQVRDHVAFVEVGELIAACATTSRRGLVLLYLYPALPAKKPHLRILLLDLVSGRLAPPAIEVPAIEGPTPTIAVTPMLHALGSDLVLLMNGGQVWAFALSCGALLNDSLGVPLAAAATPSKAALVQTVSRDGGFTTCVTGPTLSQIHLTHLRFPAEKGVDTPSFRAKEKGVAVWHRRMAWQEDTIGAKVVVAMLLSELVDAILIVCTA